ncbi:putative PHD finger and JmjC domain protein [Taphrina deformans PYCC 5710]|uniref:JmjC domain-containing histone demethylation protein 1 n=1 Tax=Taphrina deformans (strain PYCC 5710 / ATCC 11124 / CBS 356.35 / IMI 108563 / JCM 9778 / NBRC 8474) TaxID=1097556 RepID=R4X9R5_TAPDE|nr:putative PHD finger and JmjC domain protein [Taphrina deformans PYCC 5710]|eukprot:CCG80979.1 putative PHD finger and JmjC domain protein [Taphrina deformans PYCC 5710]
MLKRKAGSLDTDTEACPLCVPDVLLPDSRVEWIACEACRTWYHAKCLQLSPHNVVSYFCEACNAAKRGSTKLREERPKRAKVGIDYTALDAGEHVNSLRHSYTGLIETQRFARSLAVELDAVSLTEDYLEETGFTLPIVVHESNGLGLQIPADLSVDEVARLVGKDIPIEVMDVPTQGEDKGWTLGKWAAYYNEPSPARVRNVISLEVSDTELGKSIIRPGIVDKLDIVTRYWPRNEEYAAKRPKVQTYCLMSLQNSYTDFHVDFAGTSVYYHILKGSKTFLFIPPTSSNLHKYSDWCKSSNQGKTFLADQCKDTFKVELTAGDTMFIPSGWIHAVHTPKKSLVIGGNFLHLYGMQKHLEIADIEELTKVPGKFRFPLFTKTLWLTVFGIVATKEKLNKYQILGAFRLGQFLYNKVDASETKPGRKAFDGLPAERLVGSPITLLRIFFNLVKYHADVCKLPLPDFVTDYQLSCEESSGPVILIKTDVKADTLERLENESTAQAKKEETVSSEFIEAWVELALSPEVDNSIYRGSLNSRRHYSDTSTTETMDNVTSLPTSKCETEPEASTMIATTTILTPLADSASTPVAVQPSRQVHTKQEVHNASLQTESTSSPAATRQTNATSESMDYDYAYGNDNNYLPPLMSFSKVPTSPPRLKRNTSNPASEGPKSATTCFRCKTRKRRCDKERPCKSCVEIGLAPSCSDSGMHVPLPTTSPAQTSVVTSPQASVITSPQVEQSFTSVTQGPPAGSHNAIDTHTGDMKAKRSRKLGARCGRCARDKKQCSREEPICDRCVKKNLQPSDCIYPHQTQAEDGGTSTDHTKDEDGPVDQSSPDSSRQEQTDQVASITTVVPQSSADGVPKSQEEKPIMQGSTKPSDVSSSGLATTNDTEMSEMATNGSESIPATDTTVTTSNDADARNGHDGQENHVA